LLHRNGGRFTHGRNFGPSSGGCERSGNSAHLLPFSVQQQSTSWSISIEHNKATHNHHCSRNRTNDCRVIAPRASHVSIRALVASVAASVASAAQEHRKHRQVRRGSAQQPTHLLQTWILRRTTNEHSSRTHDPLQSIYSQPQHQQHQQYLTDPSVGRWINVAETLSFQ